MNTTTYYNLNIVEGSDIVNPLTVDNPNYEKIDEALHENAVSGVTLATEIANATVHAINRENSECSVIRFIATSNWKAGDTVTVDGVPVTALLPSGETLPNGAYVINANVLCILTGSNLTVYAERKKVDNADEIVYNDTTVANELDSINSNLGVLYRNDFSNGSFQPGTTLTSITVPKGKYIIVITSPSLTQGQIGTYTGNTYHKKLSTLSFSYYTRVGFIEVNERTTIYIKNIGSLNVGIESADYGNFEAIKLS